MDKKEIRKEILEKRKALSKEEVYIMSQKICENIMGLDAYQEAEDILLYNAIKNEVDMSPLSERALSDGKRVFFPRVMDKEHMNFYEVRGLLAVGSFGIEEPPADPALIYSGEGKKTLLVMPGIVFDVNRNRIGYGGGYYDRFLAEFENSDMTVIAASYELQVMEDEIPHEVHDIQPSAVITESRTIL